LKTLFLQFKGAVNLKQNYLVNEKQKMVVSLSGLYNNATNEDSNDDTCNYSPTGVYSANIALQDYINNK
jgi:hypothetical protein